MWLDGRRWESNWTRRELNFDEPRIVSSAPLAPMFRFAGVPYRRRIALPRCRNRTGEARIGKLSTIMHTGTQNTAMRIYRRVWWRYGKRYLKLQVDFLNRSRIVSLYHNCDSTTTRLRCDDTTTHSTTTEVIEITICVRFDCDTTTSYCARLLPLDAIRRQQKINMSIFRRSRVVVESQLW